MMTTPLQKCQRLSCASTSDLVTSDSTHTSASSSSSANSNITQPEPQSQSTSGSRSYSAVEPSSLGDARACNLSDDATVPTASRGAKAKKKRAPQTLSEAIAYDLESEEMWTKVDDNADETSTNIRFAPSFTGPCNTVGENMNFM